MKQKSITDLLINLEVILSQGEKQQKLSKFVRWLIDKNGRIVGRFDKNPALNRLVYNFELRDGAVKQYSVNIISMKVLSQFNSDGYD